MCNFVCRTMAHAKLSLLVIQYKVTLAVSRNGEF